MRLPVLLALLLAAAGAGAAPLPPAFERLAAGWDDGWRVIEPLRAVLPDAVPPGAVQRRCRREIDRAADAVRDGRAVHAPRCRRVLLEMTERLAAAAHGTLAPQIANAAEQAGRLALLLRTGARELRALSRVPSKPRTARAEVPALTTPSADGTRLRIEPLYALAPATRYRLVIPARLHPIVVWPHAGADARGALGGDPSGWSALPASLEAYRQQVVAAVPPGTAWPVRPEIVVRIDAAKSLRDVPARRIRFVIDDGRPDGGVADPLRFATIAPRLATVAATVRDAVRAAPAAPMDGTVRRPLDGVAGATVVSGVYPRRDLQTGATRFAGFTLALPATPPRAVVILLTGLDASVATLFADQAGELAARGLASLAIDLSGQGSRAPEGAFLAVLDPATTAAHFTQAVADVVALVTALRDGRIAPAAFDARTVPLALFGYSLGGMVGGVVAAVEPAIGPVVMLAPAGDLAGWLAIPMFAALRLPTHLCPGGDPAGASCSDPAHPCAAGAPCLLNPAIYALLDVVVPMRALFADVDPQTHAAALAGGATPRPVLVIEGGRDGIIPNANTDGLAYMLGADPACRLAPSRPWALCRVATATHDLLHPAAVRALAQTFLASLGASLGDIAAESAARGTAAGVAR